MKIKNKLDLKYVEVFSGHVPIKMEYIESIKKLCEKYNVKYQIL